MPTVRLLPMSLGTGSEMMAADDAMLSAAVEHGIASLRFYSWSEPTLSLGYFQAASARLAYPYLAWVRRATGGAGIVHHHPYEITYSLALPSGAPWQNGESWICRVHHMLQTVLLRHRVDSRAVLCGEEKKLGETLCFLHQTPGDLLVGGCKVVGSAQRKQKGALLQHGTILLGRSPFAPELPGIFEQAGANVTAEDIANGLQQQFAILTGWELQPGEWTAQEREQAERIRVEKYAHPDWNMKR